MSASSSASSSTSTLWATASKEWVIQPKPKPGRKPKKDTVSPAKADNEPDAKGRRVQNRAAQRAFRERKQSQLTELQARIQSYEQGEIERNVALQNIAKRLKEENEKLRQENLALQEKLLSMQQLQTNSGTAEANSPEGPEKKRRRKDECPSLTVATDTSNKKARKKSDPDLHQPVPSVPSLSFSLSVASTPDSNGTAESQFSSISYETHSGLGAGSFEQFNGLAPDLKDMEVNLRPFASFGCGFCSEDTICVCQEMAVAGSNPTEYKSDDFNIPSIPTGENMENLHPMRDEGGQRSILDNLPPYQPPVALRRRPGAVLANSVFPVHVLPDNKMEMDATCSGDPSNCMACGDDAFGKAFCAEIGKKVAMRQDYEGCACQKNSSSEAGCCGGKPNASRCESCPSSSVVDVSSTNESAELMPTNAAWRKLKAHPNIEFADLSLLAEVVSSRSKCFGPRLVISPPPQLPLDPVRGLDDLSPNLDRMDRYAHRNGRNSPPLRLVPQEVLLECGRRRVRQVHADGVREALRLLDAKFP